MTILSTIQDAQIVYQFEIWQDDELCASGESIDFEDMRSEASRYAMQYGQDGPVTVREFVRHSIATPLTVQPADVEALRKKADYASAFHSEAKVVPLVDALAALARTAHGELPHPGSPDASAMIDAVLAEYNWPCNTKNAARAGYVAALRLLGSPALAAEPSTDVEALREKADYASAFNSEAQVVSLNDALAAIDRATGAQQEAVTEHDNLPPLPDAEAWANSSNLISARLGRERYGHGACELHTWREAGPSDYHNTGLYTADQVREYAIAAFSRPAQVAAQQPVVPESCGWHEDEDGLWHSACGGVLWLFEADDPTKNGMRFCIHCGKRMVQAAATPEGDKE